MFKVGLTGGIGSGKSTLANIFADLGITIINLDALSRELVAPGQTALTQIAEHFGPEILQEDGALNRAQLRTQIFHDDSKRQWLESLLHPLIRERQNQLIESASSPYVIIEIPLLAENDLSNTVDRVLVIDVPEELQIARTSSRDEVSEDAVQRVMDAQASREERLSIADDVLVNDGTLDELRIKATMLHNRYLELAQASQN